MDIPIEELLKFTLMDNGEEFVTMGSIKQRVTLFVGCWDLTHLGKLLNFVCASMQWLSPLNVNDVSSTYGTNK